MGQCLGAEETEELKEMADQNKKIVTQLREEAKEQKLLKLLLLGTGESGKSTFAKQVVIIHGSGYTEQELISFRSIIYANVFSSIISILVLVRKLSLNLSNEMTEKEQMLLQINPLRQELTKELADVINSIWHQEVVQSTVKDNILDIADTTVYFINSVDRIASPQFIPNEEDVLRCR